MKSKDTTIQLIIADFIEVPAGKIERLYQGDSTFREICADYDECIQMRDRYASDTTDRDAHLYRQQYEALIEELGEEISAKFLRTQHPDNAPGEDRNLASPSSNQATDLNNRAGCK